MTFQPVSIPRSAAPLPQAARFTAAQAGILLFGIFASIYLAWPLWLLTSPVDLSRNEAWNAWFIDALQSGNPLYPSRNELIVNNYPPLSFYLAALVAKLTGDTIMAGASSRSSPLLSFPPLRGFAFALWEDRVRRQPWAPCGCSRRWRVSLHCTWE